VAILSPSKHVNNDRYSKLVQVR